MRTCVLPFDSPLAGAAEAAATKLRKERLRVGTKGVGEVNLAVRTKMTVEERRERRVARGLVDELGGKNRIEIGAERGCGGKIRQDAAHVRKAVSPSACADEL